MELVGDRTVPPRPPAMVSLPEQSVESFQLTEEELARPVQGRIRRRPFGRMAPEGPPGDQPPPDGPPARKPRPERRPKPEKRPLSELDHFGEPRHTPSADVNVVPENRVAESAPPPPTDEGFGSGLDDGPVTA
jgi:hypothetical protein